MTSLITWTFDGYITIVMARRNEYNWENESVCSCYHPRWIGLKLLNIELESVVG